MTTNLIEFTLPLEANGKYFSDIDVAIEVKVTSRGKPDTWSSPAQGAEWETLTHYVYIGHDGKKLVWEHAPEWLEVLIEAYEATKDGHNSISDLVRESELEPVNYLTGEKI